MDKRDPDSAADKERAEDDHAINIKPEAVVRWQKKVPDTQAGQSQRERCRPKANKVGDNKNRWKEDDQASIRDCRKPAIEQVSNKKTDDKGGKRYGIAPRRSERMPAEIQRYLGAMCHRSDQTGAIGVPARGS